MFIQFFRRAVDIVLGRPASLSTFIITARECSRALAERQVSAPGAGLRARCAAVLGKLHLESRLALVRLVAACAGMRAGRRAAQQQHFQTDSSVLQLA